MRAHGGGQHLRRQIHELVLDATHQHHRPLDQPGDFVQECRVVSNRELGAASFLLGLLLDDGAPLGGIENHLGGLQLLLVVGEARNGEFLGREKAVAGGGVAEIKRGAIAQIQRAAQLLAIEHRGHAVQGSHPDEPAIAPAHRLGPGEPLNRLDDNPGQHLGARLPFQLADQEVKAALAGLARLRLVDGGEVIASQEPLDGLFGRVQARALLFFLGVRLFGRQAGDHQRQAARGGVGARLLEGEPGAGQPFGHPAAQVLGGACLHARRNLLGQEFDQQFGHVIWPPGRAPPPENFQSLPGFRPRPRSRPWRDCARGRCKPDARSPR